MTSYETRSINTTTRKTTSSEQNDLKKLKSKYSSKLPTLKAIFSEWSDDDLLFTLDEANGDLELAIDRISEGRATQWGEVKTKKSKKEAQKQKVAAAPAISSHQQSSPTSFSSSTYSSPRKSKPSQPQRTYNNDHVNRSATTSTTGRARTIKPTVSSWDSQPKSNYQEASSGSWASIASSKQLHDDTNGWNTNNDNAATTTNDWAPVHTTNNTDDADQPKTWASLLKSKPKPESEPETTEETVQTTTTTSEWDTPITSERDIETTSKTDTPEASTGWDTPAEQPVDEWSTPVNVNESSSWDPTPVTIEEKPDVSAQEEPVVLPTNTSVNELDVKFGSLHVEEEEEAKNETPITQTTPEPEVIETSTTSNTHIPSPVQETSIPEPVSQSTTSTTIPEPEPIQQQQVEPQQAQPTQEVPQLQQTQQTQQAQPLPSQQQQQQQQQVQQTQQAQPQQPQQPQQQQPQQQQPQIQQPQFQQQPHHQQFGMDHLTSAYSSYLPNQAPTGITGFGMSPMGGSHPEYGIYGTEAQRAAAMGYYDPTSFSHSPSSAYHTRDKYGQDNGQAVPQQMYPPYYQYYYMPNQFNAYQQSAYGHQFMNKSNGYPYGQPQQQQPIKPAAGSNAYNGSPYGNTLYNNQPSYDDMNGLQDYQKSLYGGNATSQGFLGNLSNNQQQQQQSQKSDRTPTTSSAQPQMFSYQQYQQQPRQPYWNQ